MYRVVYYDTFGVAFAHRDFLDRRVAEAYFAGMRTQFPDYKLRIIEI